MQEMVVNDLKDKNYSKNAGFGISGITADLKVPQASIQYGMSDKRQDTNSTFVNSITYENGIKVDFEERGINTSLDNAQVITRDKEIEQIDTTLHTDMLNQSTRQQFVIDFLKTTTLVPQVAKGIGQGINNKELGQNVLGQLANNLGKNGFNIVAYAYDVDEKLKNTIEDHYINGKYGVGLDEYNMSEIAGLLKPLLAEYGKDFYDIKFVEAEDIASGMSINDRDGVVYINTYGQGFGHSSEMLEQLGHEGMHGTYADKNVDEKAASMLTKIPSKGWSSSIGATAITINAQGMIEASTNQYYKDRVNGDLRDATYGAVRVLNIVKFGVVLGYVGGHQFVVQIPDNQDEFFDISSDSKTAKLKQKYIDIGWNFIPKKFSNGKWGWTIGAHKDKDTNLLKVLFNEDEDLKAAIDLTNEKVLNYKTEMDKVALTSEEIEKKFLLISKNAERERNIISSGNLLGEERKSLLDPAININKLYQDGKSDRETIIDMVNTALFYEKKNHESKLSYNMVFRNCNTWMKGYSESLGLKNVIYDYQTFNDINFLKNTVVIPPGFFNRNDVVNNQEEEFYGTVQ